MKKPFLYFIPLILVISCNKDDENQPVCPPFHVTFNSPTSDPVWHPSGEFIGFNHTPLKRIVYTYGYNCPDFADYETVLDSTGFYLVNADGTNQRMVLPFELHTPAWSPDGEWIAFHRGRNIYKMPFEGKNFDTTRIVQLTSDGGNTYPAWSPDGEWIAYNNNNCGNADNGPPPNSCGILIMKPDGSERKFIGIAGQPYWSRSGKDIACVKLFDEGRGLASYSIEDSIFHLEYLLPENANTPGGMEIKFSPDGEKISFLMQLIEDKTFNGTTIYTIERSSKSLDQVVPFNIFSYDWSPSNEIVYLNFDYERLDEKRGVLWIMNADGTNQRQLTFHRDLEIIIP